MPNIPQQETIVQYVANSSQSQYTFAFYAPLSADIQVYYQASTAVPIPSSDILNLNSDYTVTFNADPITGGYITLLFTPVTGYYLTINRQVQASLNVNFADARTFSGATLDAALDRLLLLCQQNQNYALERNLSYIINTYLPDAAPFTQLPPLEQNFIWIGSGSGVVAAEVSTVPSASVLQSLLASNSPGTDGARIVGYYDAVDSLGTTVQAFLANIVPFMQSQLNLQLLSPGMMIDYAGTSVPTGFLLCDGSAVSRTTYAALFTAINTTWGIGDGTTTFNLPDFRRSVSVGSGGVGTVTLGSATGNAGGSETHTLVNTELPDPIGTPTVANAQSGISFSAVVSVNAVGAGVIKNNSGNQPHNIIQPSAVVTKIIKT